MGLYDFSAADIINARERFNVPPKLEPKVDDIVSKIVGFKVFQQDPRLIKLIIKWKAGKSQDSKEPDNFLNDPLKIQELKDTLSKPI